METKRAYDLQQQLVARLKDVFSCTRFYHRTCDAHIEAAKHQVFDTKEFKVLPLYRREFIRGAESILWDHLYEGKDAPLLYVKIGPDGKLYGPGNDDWLNESSEYKSALTGVHAWADAWEKNNELKRW